jgi:hypothetical protein
MIQNNYQFIVEHALCQELLKQKQQFSSKIMACNFLYAFKHFQK